MKQRMLSYRELKSEKGIQFTRRWIRTLEKQGKFPKRVKQGGRTVAWFETEIDGTIAEWDRLRQQG